MTDVHVFQDHEHVYVLSQSLMHLSSYDLEGQNHPYMKASTTTYSIPYMLQDAIDTYMDSGVGQYKGTSHHVQ